MEKIVLFGKGGSGKSTIATNLSYIYARMGFRVLHVGCDPKKDSTLRLLGGRPRTTLMNEFLASGTKGKVEASKFIMRGRHGIDCVESGGPEPGVGCAGRGIILMMEQFDKLRLLEDDRYDVAVFDVLGDLVCGGFASPLRYGFAQKVFIVVSEEWMSLHAANNIAKMVPTYAANGISLGGLIANMRSGDEAGMALVRRFAEAIASAVVQHIPRDPLIMKAERENKTVAEYAPDSPISKLFEKLAETLLDIKTEGLPLPTPMDDESLDRFFKSAG